MTKFYVLLAVLLAGAAGGFFLGVRVATPHTPPPLSADALQALRVRVADLKASQGRTVERWREVVRTVPVEVAKDAEAIAAGAEPIVAAAFDVAPTEVERVTPPPECDPCEPEEFRVAGVFEAFAGGESALVGSLTHAHGDAVIWRAKLQGDLAYKPPPLPPRAARWLAGGYVALDRDGEKAYGAIIGRTWSHVAIFGGADDSPRIMAGAMVRW